MAESPLTKDRRSRLEKLAKLKEKRQLIQCVGPAAAPPARKLPSVRWPVPACVLCRVATVGLTPHLVQTQAQDGIDEFHSWNTHQGGSGSGGHRSAKPGRECATTADDTAAGPSRWGCHSLAEGNKWSCAAGRQRQRLPCRGHGPLVATVSKRQHGRRDAPVSFFLLSPPQRWAQQRQEKSVAAAASEVDVAAASTDSVQLAGCENVLCRRRPGRPVATDGRAGAAGEPSPAAGVRV